MSAICSCYECLYYHQLQYYYRLNACHQSGYYGEKTNYSDVNSTHLCYDFRNGYDPNDFPIIFGDDGMVTQNKSGLTISSTPFTFTISVGNEHPKWLHYYKNTFNVPCKGELIYEAKVAVRQDINLDIVPPILRSRIRNIQDDIRLCTAGINLLDQKTWMVADFFLSNQSIYAFYERLPFGRAGTPIPSELSNLYERLPEVDGHNPPNDYAAFSNAIRVGSRTANPEKDFHKLAIGINRDKDYIKWYIDGKEVFRVDQIGTRLPDEYRLLEHGGQAQSVADELGPINIGFGTFSLLDMALPYNYSREYVQGDSQAISQLVQLELDPPLPNYPSGYAELYQGLTGKQRGLIDPSETFAVTLGQFPNDNQEIKLFGQGAVLRLKYIKVYVKDC